MPRPWLAREKRDWGAWHPILRQNGSVGPSQDDQDCRVQLEVELVPELGDLPSVLESA